MSHSPSQSTWSHAWIASLALPTLSLLLAHLLFTPHYYSDDEAVIMIASGQGIAARPSAYVLFMHPVMGQLLSSLYGAAPDVPWYRIVMLSIQWSAGVVLSYSALKSAFNPARVAILIAYFLLTDLSLVVYAQFTTTAATAGVAAVAVWLFQARLHGWTPGRLALFIGLITLAGLLRFEAAMLALVMTAPLVALVWLVGSSADDGAIERLPLKQGAARHLLPFALALGMIQLANASHGWIYASTPGWDEYWARRRPFAEFIDYARVPYGPQTAHLYAKVGWTENDYLLLLNYFFADREVFATERFEKILEGAPPRRTESFAMSWFRLEMLALHGLPWHALGIGLLPIFFLRRDWQSWLSYLAVLGLLALLAFLLFGLWHRLPARVFVSFAMFLALTGIALSHATFTKAYLVRCVCAAVVALPIFGDAYLRMHRSSKDYNAKCERVQRTLTALAPTPDQLYINWGLAFPWRNAVRPWGTSPEFRDMRFYSIGAAANTPITDGMLREFGIDDWLITACTRDNVIVICDQEKANLLVKFLLEHRGISARYEPVHIDGIEREILSLYRFRVNSTSP